MSDFVAGPGRGAEETEGDGFAGDESEFAVFERFFGAFLHALGNDADGFDFRFQAGDGEGGGFESEIIGAGGAGADADAFAAERDASVMGGAAGDGEIEVDAGQFGNGFAGPAGEEFENALAEGGRVEDAAVEEDGVGAEKRAGAERFGNGGGELRVGLGVGEASGEEAGEVFADDGIVRVGESEFAEAGGAVRRGMIVDGG